MTDAAPPPAALPRKPRKVFLLVGVVAAAGLGIGLFTSIGTAKNTGPPHAGGAVPSFSATQLNGKGTVRVTSGAIDQPTVLLFFGNWCDVCHSEMPRLATAIRHQRESRGPLADVRIIGVDSEDTVANAKSFIRSSGMTFPVAYDPDVTITSGDFYFEGDPYAVFVKADGTIDAIIGGPLSTAQFTAAEEKLTPSGS